jgi:hypothetical protein
VSQAITVTYGGAVALCMEHDEEGGDPVRERMNSGLRPAAGCPSWCCAACSLPAHARAVTSLRSADRRACGRAAAACGAVAARRPRR